MCATLTSSQSGGTPIPLGGNSIPRRDYVKRWTLAERAIKDAVEAVEEAGTHPLLTDAVVLLQEAFNKVADYTDQVKGEEEKPIAEPPTPTQAAPPAQRPTVGRIVHYVLAESDDTRNPGEHRAAMVVRTWGGDCVQLQVFMDGTNDGDRFGENPLMWVTSCAQDEELKSGRTWHWPERE